MNDRYGEQGRRKWERSLILGWWMEGAVGNDMEGKITNGHLKRIERKVKGEEGWVFWSRVIFMEGLLPCVG